MLRWLNVENAPIILIEVGEVSGWEHVIDFALVASTVVARNLDTTFAAIPPHGRRSPCEIPSGRLGGIDIAEWDSESHDAIQHREQLY